ncbi:MAG: hypothetical protein ACPGUD_09470 [Parashewanella sp.]
MFDESNPYFSVPHKFKAYIELWPSEKPLPDAAQLQDLQSVGLQLLTEVKNIESNCLMQLRRLENDTKSVVDYLKLQSKKIDLILQYVLESESQDGSKVQGVKFGGDGIEIISPTAVNIGEHYKTTVFIRDELIALLAFTKATDCQPHPQLDKQWLVTLNFCQILEADVELLVQASLSVQQKALRKLSQQRKN